MKKHLLILLSIILFSCVYAQDHKIIGTWEGEDLGEIGTLQFDTSGFAYFYFEDEIIGGPSYEIDGLDVSLIYKIDYSKSPHWIDFKIILNDDQSQFDSMLGIFEFQDDYTKIKICFAFETENERPITFIDDDTTILIKKE